MKYKIKIFEFNCFAENRKHFFESSLKKKEEKSVYMLYHKKAGV
jgi:hypothetical protein